MFQNIAIGVQIRLHAPRFRFPGEHGAAFVEQRLGVVVEPGVPSKPQCPRLIKEIKNFFRGHLFEHGLAHAVEILSGSIVGPWAKPA